MRSRTSSFPSNKGPGLPALCVDFAGVAHEREETGELTPAMASQRSHISQDNGQGFGESKVTKKSYLERYQCYRLAV